MPKSLRHNIVPLVTSLLAVAAQALPGPLRYERAALLDGELWRLLTAHFVHLGPTHLLLNLAALWLIWWLFRLRFCLRVWVAVFALSALGCGLGLLLFSPDLTWYVGLSGVLHGLLAAGAIGEWRAGERTGAALFTGALIAKLAWEQLTGPMPGSEALVGGRVVVEAHLYGASAGALAAVLFCPRRTAASTDHLGKQQ